MSPAYEYYNGYKESHNGCIKRKCPCRLWINCRTYVDIQKMHQRLKKKDLDEYYKPFNDWYNNNFKVEPEMGSSIANG